MDKLDMQSKNLVDENINKIAELFPNCITEGQDENGKLTKLVDFDLLKQELSKEIVEGNDERYTLNWAGKKQAILTANSPINATLRPCREESVDFDSTKNLYIEGDNLDVLKLLRETYLNKVKMIYIDPPYNTGNDFVYEDDFASSTEDYLQASKSYDDQGNRMFQNNDSNGRFHSDWLSMMYSRLKLAKDLLTDDGVIFISIDDNEQENLKKICNEIFGELNFIGTHIRKTVSQRAMAKNYNTQHEYCLIYTKNYNNFDLCGDEKNFDVYSNPDNDPRGDWKTSDPTMSGSKNNFEIINPYNGKIDFPPKGRGWAFTKEKFDCLVDEGMVIFKKGCKESERGFIYKAYKKDLRSQNLLLNSLDVCENQYMNQVSTKEMMELFDERMFDYAKPVSFVRKILSYDKNKESIILDFFSGSATTAHAVMQLNAEDGGNRKFIMVQIPECCDENSEAYKAGYKNICEIGKERIRRAGVKIKEDLKNWNKKSNKESEGVSEINGIPFSKSVSYIDEEGISQKDKISLINKADYYKFYPDNLDIGFRDLKLDSSCMKDVYYDPTSIKQDMLSQFEDNIKEDRTPEDLLFQVMLDMGVLLSSEIKVIDIQGKKVFNVNDGDLVCCFDKNLTDEVVTEIAKLQPLYAVFRDSSMSSDSVAVNFDQIFETYSPTTIRKIL